MDEQDKNKNKKSGPFDVPLHLLFILVSGNILLGWMGYFTYAKLGFNHPLIAETLTLFLVNLAALCFRWKLPKTWSKLTGEKFEK